MKIINLIFGLIVITSINYKSYACTCIGGKRTIKKAFKHNDIIFYGKVIYKEKVLFDFIPTSRGDTIKFYKDKYTFMIKKVFKGKIKCSTIEIVTGKGHGDCGISFKLGKNYIVYSHWEKLPFNPYLLKQKRKLKEKYLDTNICTRTTMKIREELDKINKYLAHRSWIYYLFRRKNRE